MAMKILHLLLAVSVGLVAGVTLERQLLRETISSETALEHAAKHRDPNYVCPMHAEIVSDQPGSCPICGMDLVKRQPPGGEIDLHVDESMPVVTMKSAVINNLGVRTAEVRRGTLVRRIETPGFIQQITKDAYTRINAPAKGRFIRFLVEPDQWLEAGDAMAEISLKGLADVQQKHLDLLADAGHDGDAETGNGEDSHTGITIAYTRQLLLKAGMTDADISRLEADREIYDTITLKAEHAGTVLERRVRDGDEITSGQLLFVLGGMMRATVLANAFQRDAAWIKPGQAAEIVLPFDADKVWKGVVSQGAVSLNVTSQSIGIQLSFTAPNDLIKPGMYVVGQIFGQVRDDALVIPADAVIYSAAGNRVICALGGGRFKPVPVTVGISSGDEVEILSGVEVGDVVVTSAQFLIDSESSLQASFRRLGG